MGMDYDPKEARCQKYNAKFKNRGKMGTCHGGHSRVGNARSLSRSRPTAPTQRVSTNMDLEDIVNYKAIDRRICGRFDRKTYARGLVSYDSSPKMNQQIGNDSHAEKKIRTPEPKCVHLTEIRDGLYLANYDWVSTFDRANYDDVVIINLSNNQKQQL